MLKKKKKERKKNLYCDLSYKLFIWRQLNRQVQKGENFQIFIEFSFYLHSPFWLVKSTITKQNNHLKFSNLQPQTKLSCLSGPSFVNEEFYVVRLLQILAKCLCYWVFLYVDHLNAVDFFFFTFFSSSKIKCTLF